MCQLLTTSDVFPFPSLTLSNTYYFPHQSSRSGTAAANPTNGPCPTTSSLSLKPQDELSCRHLPDCAFPNRTHFTLTRPAESFPRASSPSSPGRDLPASSPTHLHSHFNESALSVSPMMPVSPQNFSPVHLSTQPTFTFDFDDPPGAGLSPDPDPVLQRRPSTGSHSTSSAELAVVVGGPGVGARSAA